MDFAPRLGLAWQVLPRTVIRAGYGRFFAYQETRTGDPFQLYYNLPFVAEPNYITDGVTPVLTVSGGFPALDLNSITGASVTTSADRSRNASCTRRRLDEWNLNIQHELPANTLVELAYVGSKSTHLQTLARLEPGPDARTGDIQSRRPYPQYGGFSNIVDRGNSTYHALQLKVQKRTSHGLMFLSAFTFSKSINDQPEICCSSPTPQNSYDLASEKGPSDFDQRFRWVTSFDYQLPIGNGERFMSSNRVEDLDLWRLALGRNLSRCTPVSTSPRR